MVAKFLNNQQRIIIYLSRYSNSVEEFIAPWAITQEGIGKGIGIGRNNVPREMKKLMENGYVSSKKLHVNGVRNRRTVYFLTPKGFSEAQKIKEEIKDIYVNVIDSSGEKKEVLLSEVPKKYGIDFILCAINLDKKRNLDLVTILRKRGKAFHSIDENLILRDFYGREKELKKMEKWLKSNRRILILTGISGIGKTTLLLKFVKENLKEKNVLFIKIESWKSADNILNQIATFFSRIGAPKIEKYIRSATLSEDRKLNWNNVLILLKESFRDEVLIFDNIENGDRGTKELIRKIVDMVSSTSNFRLILSGTEIRNVVSSSKLGEVEEIKLGELNESDAIEMLKQHGLEEDRAIKIVSLYGGNPLMLQIAKDQNYPMMRRYIFEGILKNLGPEEREALEFISVFRKNFKMNVLLFNNFEYFTLYSLINKNILLEMEYENFTVHRIIRNFVYNHLTDEKRRKYHLMAARYYEESDDILEAVYHYTRAGKLVRANIILSEHYEKHLFERGTEIRKLAVEILNHYDDVVEDHEWQLYEIIGDTYNISGKWDDSLKNYEKAKFLSKEHDSDFYAKIVVKISEILGKMGKYEEAIKSLKEVFKDITRISDKRTISRAYYLLGIMSIKIGNTDDAKRYMLESIKVAEKVSDIRNLGYSYNGLGLIERGEGALQYFRKAREYLEAYGDMVGLAKVLRNIGIVYYEMYDDNAEKYLREAMNISQKIGDKWGTGFSYLWMANWNMYKERFFKSKEYLEKSRRVFEELKASGGLAYTYNSFGTFYAYLGDRDMGKKCFDKAISLAAQIGDEKAIIEISKDAAEYLRKYGQKYVEEYEKIARGEKKVVALVNL